MNSIRIAELRKSLGLSQEELAVKLNISQKSISKYERGDRRPFYEVLVAMASLFGVSTDYLLGKTDDKDGIEQEEPFYTNERERNLLNLYREYEENGFSVNIADRLSVFFKEIYNFNATSPSSKKLLNAFLQLNEDNQDIIIGKTKELLREQHLEESAVAAVNSKKVVGK